MGAGYSESAGAHETEMEQSFQKILNIFIYFKLHHPMMKTPQNLRIGKENKRLRIIGNTGDEQWIS